jgi:hypothetical protein
MQMTETKTMAMMPLLPPLLPQTLAKMSRTRDWD